MVVVGLIGAKNLSRRVWSESPRKKLPSAAVSAGPAARIVTAGDATAGSGAAGGATRIWVRITDSAFRSLAESVKWI